MDARLYYFTGTGNSLYAARRLAELLGGAEVLSIAAAMRAGAARIEAETVGIVTPLYFSGWPAIVRDFLEKAEFVGTRYAFLVFTAGKPLLESITAQARSALRRKGLRLDASFGVAMVDSYAPKFAMAPESPEQSAAIERRLEAVARTVAERGRAFGPRLPLSPTIVSRIWLAGAPKLDARFTAGDSCNGCGTCARVCPVGNIVLTGARSRPEGPADRPAWSGRCQFCLACLHACPRGCIEHGRSTQGKGRYRNKNVSLRDLMQD